LPFPHPERLVMIKEVLTKISADRVNLAAPDLVEVAKSNRSFEAVAGFKPDAYEVSGGGAPEQVRGMRSTASLMTVLGVAPQLGRNFTVAEEDHGEKVVLISYALWQRHFAGDRSALGRTIRLDRTPYTIV